MALIIIFKQIASHPALRARRRPRVIWDAWNASQMHPCIAGGTAWTAHSAEGALTQGQQSCRCFSLPPAHSLANARIQKHCLWHAFLSRHCSLTSPSARALRCGWTVRSVAALLLSPSGSLAFAYGNSGSIILTTIVTGVQGAGPLQIASVTICNPRRGCSFAAVWAEGPDYISADRVSACQLSSTLACYLVDSNICKANISISTLGICP